MNSQTPIETKIKRSKIRTNLVRGIAVLFPVYLTYLMIPFLIAFFSKPLTPAFKQIFLRLQIDAPQPVIDTIVILSSLLVTMLLLFFTGMIAQRVIGRKTVDFLERMLNKLPIVRTIYKAFREITKIMTGESVQAYEKVVYINLPDGMGKVLGFITGTIKVENNEMLHTVFVPTAPNITSGFLLLMKPEQLRSAQISPEEGIRLVLSAGVLTNDEK
ncbi:DUF502 domain-containing protein [bacterium]|nr:DUF502 domain-containing protein [candidate division CSSED10-310 bacterium]